MKKIISKELLSEVLCVEINDIVNSITTPSNILEYEINTGKPNHLGDDTVFKQINIYELAHKCKEWAKKLRFIYMNKGKPLSETRAGLEIRVSVTQLYNDWYGVEIITLDCRFRTISNLRCKTFPTESEAIFEACEWIFKNKESKKNENK